METTSAVGGRIESRNARQVARLTRLIIAVDRAIYVIARHWLAAVNAVFAAQFLSVLLAPILATAGMRGLAEPIYRFNGLFCHQREERTFALFGEEMACCQRCAAIYGALMLAGIGFALFRSRLPGPRLSFALLLALPVALDGGGQMAGLWSSTAFTRVVTGTALGLAICWLLLPYLDTGFARMRAQLETLFARLVTEGRARPL